MTQRKFLLSTDQISKDVSCYTIGFALLTVKDNVEDASCGGSGTLVTIGSIHGILTAAHVVECALPKQGPVGVILDVTGAGRFDRQRFEMGGAQTVILRSKEFGSEGPDIAFLRLPEESLGWIKAKSSFYSLSKRRDEVLANQSPTSSHTDAIFGMIDEMTEVQPSGQPRVRRKVFTALFGGGSIVGVRSHVCYEILQFEMRPDTGFALPESFEGTSGGALWRFYVIEKNGKIEVADRRLIGVPFFQSPLGAPKKVISCHGPRSIYGYLTDNVIKRWREEVTI